MAETGSVVADRAGFCISTGVFAGPIDLLLHLVKQNELPIERVSLAEVCEQYLLHVEKMKDMDLEVAAEYLVIAATLLSIKASVLLNEPVELVMDEEGNLIDPHEELLRRLREAQVYREGAFELGCRSVLGMDVFSPPSALGAYEAPPVVLKDHDALLLGKAFRLLLEKTGSTAQMMHISFDSVSVVQRMMDTLASLRRCGGRASFWDLVPSPRDRGALIVSLISLLELCKRAIIGVEQAAEDKIVITLRDSTSERFSDELISSVTDESKVANQ